MIHVRTIRISWADVRHLGHEQGRGRGGQDRIEWYFMRP